VDYDFGRITFLTSAGKDPDAKIEIDYENRSMFDVTRKTLAGMRADWQFTDFAKLGGTLIYRSETVSDKRPRIGNENIQMCWPTGRHHWFHTSLHHRGSLPCR
jgi:cell surface protein SprA